MDIKTKERLNYPISIEFVSIREFHLTAQHCHMFTQAMVLGIWGSLVVWWRLCIVLGPSSVTLLRTLADPAIVFILLEFRELEEFGVRSVPAGLSALSCEGSMLGQV